MSSFANDMLKAHLREKGMLPPRFSLRKWLKSKVF